MATREQLIEDFADHKYATGEKFERLINSMKVVQLPVTDPAASGTSLSFIDSIEQDKDGKITATKKTLDLSNAHELNPFKGWYKTGDTLPTDGFDGAYLYFKDTSELTGQTTIYRWNGTTYADTGTVVDTSNVQTFGSGQAVNTVKIKDENGEQISEPADVLSAESGAKLADVTTDIVSSPNFLNPSTIDIGYYVKKTDGTKTTGLSNVCYGCTDYMEIPEEGLICNLVLNEAGSYGCSLVVYDENKDFVGYKSRSLTSRSLSVLASEFQGAKYVRFNLGLQSDLPFGENFAVYKGTTLPSEYSEWFEPYRKIKEIPDASVTTNKLADASVTTNKLADESVTTNKLADESVLPNKTSFFEITDYQRSKNLLYLANWNEGHFYNSSGQVSTGGSFKCTPIACLPNTNYRLSVASSVIGADAVRVVLFGGNLDSLVFLEDVGGTLSYGITITTTAETTYIGISAAKTAVQLQLELGTSRTSYEEPYQPIPINKIKDEYLEIPDASVTINKIAETRNEYVGENICNPAECTFEVGKYINRENGNAISSPTTSIGGYSGYIPIDERGLAFTNILYGGLAIGGAVYYEKDGNLLYKRNAGNTGIVAYDAGDSSLPLTNPLRYPDAYVRFTFASGVTAENAMVNTGLTKKSYKTYEGSKKVISPNILPNNDIMLSNRGIYTDKLQLLLPEKFYAVRGDILQIFNAGLGKIIGLENRYVQQNCGIGSQWKRYFELDATLKCTFTIPSGTNAQLNDEYTCNGNVFKVTKTPSASSPTTLSCTYKGYASMPNTGTLQKITGNGAETISFTSFTDSTPTAGERNLVFKVYDDNQNVLAQSSTILKLVNYPKSPVNEKHILCIGSSTIDGGEIVGETQRRLLTNNGTPEGNGLSNITFVGRQIVSYGGQTVHLEGNSGWAWKDYATEGRGARTFRFYLSGSGNQVVQGNQYTNNGHVYTVTEVNTIEGVETIKCETDASTSSPTASGTLTPISGATYPALTYTSAVQDSSNPFWDSINQKLDFTSYVNNYCDGSIDIVYTLLGVNAMFQGVAAQEGYVRTFIESLHTEFPNCKIVLATDAYPSMKLMMPGYGANGDSFANTYKVKVWMADVFNMYKSLSKEYSTRTEDPIDVSFELWAAQVDIDYNSEVMEKAVNTRNNSYKEPYAANTIHPGIKGYYQEADALYRSIVANLCQE